MSLQRDQRDFDAMMAQRAEERHSRVFSSAQEMIEKGVSARTVFGLREMEALRPGEVKLLEELEKLRKKQESQQLSKDVGPNLALLGSEAQRNPDDPQAQRAFQSNLAGVANNPHLLQRLGPEMGVRGMEAEGRLPEQLGAAGVVKEAERVKSQDPVVMQSRRAAEIRLRIADGMPITEHERQFLNEIINTDPRTALLRKAMGDQGLLPGSSPVSGAPKENPSERRKRLTTEFKDDPDAKGWRVVQNPKTLNPTQRQQFNAGIIIIENKSDPSKRAFYTGR